MEVLAEGVVPPDDVPEQLIVSPVVRCVDDPLLLPVGPGMRAGRAEEDVHRLDEGAELRATLGHRRRNVRKSLLPAGADLDLGRDQLSDEVLFEPCAPGGVPHLLEAVREVQRLRIEERELLLDRDREVRRVLELRPRLGDLLLRRQPLLVAHEAHYSS
jgi:hypothetical protein